MITLDSYIIDNKLMFEPSLRMLKQLYAPYNKVKLTALSAECFTWLMENKGSALNSEQLQKLEWGSLTFSSSTHNLERDINLIRRSLTLLGYNQPLICDCGNGCFRLTEDADIRKYDGNLHSDTIVYDMTFAEGLLNEKYASMPSDEPASSSFGALKKHWLSGILLSMLVLTSVRVVAPEKPQNERIRGMQEIEYCVSPLAPELSESLENNPLFDDLVSGEYDSPDLTFL